MRRHKLARTLTGLLAAFSLALVGLAVNAGPASAAVTPHYDVIYVSGSVTFHSQYSYTVYGIVENPFPQGSVSYTAEGMYAAGGSGNYVCTSSHHANNVYGTVRSWSDYRRCSYANIHNVRISEFHNGSFAGWVHVDNPYV
jgi:hypothetical protein